MTTTIAVSTEMRNKIRSLGRSGETYDDILRRMYEATSANLLLAYLYDDSDSVTVDDAIKGARKRWQKSS